MSQKQSGTFPEQGRDFQSILKNERAGRGWSQAEVARKIGSDPKTVGRWERGVTFPGLYMSQQLSTLYGKSIQELGLLRVAAPVVEHAESGESQVDSPPVPEPARAGRAIFWKDRRVLFGFLVPGLLIVLLLCVGIGLQWWPLHRSAEPALPGNPYVNKGVLALNETLRANSAAGWSLNVNEQGQCFFADGTYRIRDIQDGFMKVCLANETYFTNFTYEVNMTIEAGDCGGPAFRTTFPQLDYFLACLDGHYRFVRYDKDNPTNTRIIASGISPAIHQGLNVTNVLAVVAVGDAFTIYVNHIPVVHATDGAYLDGQIGMLAHTCRMIYPDARPNLCDEPTEVSFSDARVWNM